MLGYFHDDNYVVAADVFFKFLFCYKNPFRNTIWVSNSVDPDVQTFCGAWFRSADDTTQTNKAHWAKQ